jgi:hypothetical protein
MRVKPSFIEKSIAYRPVRAAIAAKIGEGGRKSS